ncbi:MAG: hypothetical protein RIS88_2105 [Pseudomonadota bacterium]|jgi:ribosomal-protein-alanine N-acetyltransferase
MNAILRPNADDLPEARFEPMTPEHLDVVIAIEATAYPHPWTRGNFSDSLRAGYQAQVLVAGETLLGYFVAMKGVDEVHLLNITIAPEHQGQGWGHFMLDALATWSRGQGAQWLWLEVRASNEGAQRLYARHGYRRMGQRKAYYPGAHGRREDAIVMSLAL